MCLPKMHFGRPEELENPPFSLYMGRPPTEGSALQETAPDLEFIPARAAPVNEG
jgi:hypothetical protein